MLPLRPTDATGVRVATLSPSGRQVWEHLARPKFRACCEEAPRDISIDDTTHALRYLIKILGNLQRLDAQWLSGDGEAEPVVRA